MKKNKKVIIFSSVLVLVLIAGIIVGMHFLKKGQSYNNNPISLYKEPTHVMTYATNGEVGLYSLKSGKELSTFDLKTLSTGKKASKKVVPKTDQVLESNKKDSTAKTEEKMERKPANNNQQKKYKGFYVVKVKVKAGDNAWNIQKKLTPDENLNQMLVYLRDLNDYVMHPIHPNETYLFLAKNPQDNPYKNSKSQIKTKNDKEKKPVQKETLEKKLEPLKENVTVQELGDKAKYVFYEDESKHTLYAYNDIEDAIYKVVKKGNELKGEVLYQNEKDLYPAEKLIVQDDKAYLLHEDKEHIQEIDMKKNQITEYKTKGIVDEWITYNNNLYYTYEDRLVSFNTETKEVNDILLGEKTKGIVQNDKYLYVLNNFGSNTNSSILMKIDANTMDVVTFVELDDDETALFKDVIKETLMIGHHSELKALDGKTKKTPKMSEVDLEKLQIKESKWEADYQPSMKLALDTLYHIEDGKLQIIKKDQNEASKTFDVIGEHIMLLQ